LPTFLRLAEILTVPAVDGRAATCDDAEFLTLPILLCRVSIAFRHKVGKAEGGSGLFLQQCRLSDIDRRCAALLG